MALPHHPSPELKQPLKQALGALQSKLSSMAAVFSISPPFDSARVKTPHPHKEKGRTEMKQLKFTCYRCGHQKLGSVEQVRKTFPQFRCRH